MKVNISFLLLTNLLMLSLSVCWAVTGTEMPSLPAAVGSNLALAPDDFALKMAAEHEWSFTASPEHRNCQVVLCFRVRIDSPTLVGSTNMLRVAVNGEHVALRTRRRQVRLLNKPNRFEWKNALFLTWYIPKGEWRVGYTPSFDVLPNASGQDDTEAFRFELDISDLVREGTNTLRFINTGNAAIAKNAGCDLTLVFRDLKLDIRPGPGVLPGSPEKLDRSSPFTPRMSRSSRIDACLDAKGQLVVAIRGHEYRVMSRFSVPGKDGTIQWLSFEGSHASKSISSEKGRSALPPVILKGAGWRLSRTFDLRAETGRLFVHDTFTNTSKRPVGIRIEHSVQGSVHHERVFFGGRDDPSIDEFNVPAVPYMFLPQPNHGLALAACDDVLRQHGFFTYDCSRNTARLRDDYFGLRPDNSYTTTWAIYATDSPNPFDFVNMFREDWLKPFTIEGGINFFQPDRILAYNDNALRRQLDMLNINIAMSQGGWLDRKMNRPNIGHGPIVADKFYADYRRRLKLAIEKLRRLRPNIKCLIYYDANLVAGVDYVERYKDSIITKRNGSPRMYQKTTQYGMPLAGVCPTLDSTLGRDILAKIPAMILDEIGADGIYWDEMPFFYTNRFDYARYDGYTFEINVRTGEVESEAAASELASLSFKLALLKAFRDRGAMVIGNGSPGTLTEYGEHVTRFEETKVPSRPGAICHSQLFTPVGYSGYTLHRKPGVTEADFLDDIRDKLWGANLYFFSTYSYYKLFTHENLVSYQYPITPLELDAGVIIGKERIITLRSGRFGWRGKAWKGELILFDADQRILERRRVKPGADGFIVVELPADGAAVIVRDNGPRAQR